MENPFRQARLQAGMTQADLATFAQVSRLTVTLTEQGLYIQPPEGIIRALWDHLPEGYLNVYERFIHAKRAINRTKLRIENWSDLSSFSDYIEMVSNGSVSGFAKLIVLPLRTVQSFVGGGPYNGYVANALTEILGEGHASWLLNLPRP